MRMINRGLVSAVFLFSSFLMTATLSGSNAPVLSKMAMLSADVKVNGTNYRRTAGGIVIEIKGKQYIVCNLHTMFKPEEKVDIEKISAYSDLGTTSAKIVWPKKDDRHSLRYRDLDLAVLEAGNKISSTPFFFNDFVQEDDGSRLLDSFIIGPADGHMVENPLPMSAGIKTDKGKYWSFQTLSFSQGNSGSLIFKLGENEKVIPKGILGGIVSGVMFEGKPITVSYAISQASIMDFLDEYFNQSTQASF